MKLNAILKGCTGMMLVATLLAIPNQVSQASVGETVSSSVTLVGDNGAKVSFGKGTLTGYKSTGTATATTTTNDGKATDTIKAQVSTYYGTSGYGDSNVNSKNNAASVSTSATCTNTTNRRAKGYHVITYKGITQTASTEVSY